MHDGEKATIVLIAASEELLNKLTLALVNTNLALLHAQSKREAIALLERLGSDVRLAIVELELPDFEGWDLIRRLSFLPKESVKLIATTSTYPEQHFARIKEIGVDAVIPSVIDPEEWRKAVEALLAKSKTTTSA